MTSGLLCSFPGQCMYSPDSDYFQGISSAVTLSEEYEVHSYAKDYAPAEVCRVKPRHSLRVDLYNSIPTGCNTAVRTWYSGYRM